jgi:hypothetical protein
MPTTYTLIETKRLVTATNSVSFSSIPQTYGTLILKVSAQDNAGGANRTDVWFTPNGNNSADVATNRVLFYDGTNKLRDYYTSQGATMAIPTAGNGSAYFSGIEITIPNYTSTSTRKTYLGLGAFAASTSQSFNELSIWNNNNGSTSAITSFDIRCNTSANFSVGSSFSLYGLAKA